ncbi:hypothetical protein SAMN05661093_04988 [Kibdelosporangium aridum]|uniref:Uncharacterized protein n=1 Tax=Kibdelosporangium aridum TaxID=2030 RepID=A0A1W2EYC2_KIBAR|nr:hypothetical protein SAMN05661093_04988 [Kibdelosporangium aridum]
MYAWRDPASDLVALRGGPRNLRWYTYRDWLTARQASRRLGYRLSHACGSDRCYAPTIQWAKRTDEPESSMQARVWAYIPPAQWNAWGREYLTPEEQTPCAPTIPAPRTRAQATRPAARPAMPQPVDPRPDGETAMLPLWTTEEVTP